MAVLLKNPHSPKNRRDSFPCLPLSAFGFDLSSPLSPFSGLFLANNPSDPSFRNPLPKGQGPLGIFFPSFSQLPGFVFFCWCIQIPPFQFLPPPGMPFPLLTLRAVLFQPPKSCGIHTLFHAHPARYPPWFPVP